MSDIREITEDRKDKLRKMRTVPPMVKKAVYAGAQGKDAVGACTQFQSDVRVYNLWEALLYVQNYEEDGYYVKGTAEKAVAAAFEREGEE